MNTKHGRFALAILVSILCMAIQAPAQHYAEVNGWWFHNFRTSSGIPGSADFPWDLYRDAYLGILPTRDPWSSGFDVLFYDLVYEKELGSKGNCYGMSLMSLLIVQKGGHLGFCAPLSQYSGDISGTSCCDNKGNAFYTGPSDPRLRRAINQMHGHQVNLPTLKLILELIAKAKNRDGSYAYNQVLYYKMRNDPTLVSVTKSLNPDDGAHTMVAYDARVFNGQKRIFLYDPNRTWGNPSASQRGWYQSNRNYITIDSTGSGSWHFHHSDSSGVPKYWSGSPSSGGNIMITPISVTGPTSRSPSSLGLNVSDILTTFFIAGDGAGLEQVNDSKGKRLFKPGTMEVDINPATGMLNMMPWYASDEDGLAGDARGSGTVYFLLGNPGGPLDLQIRSGSTGYRLHVAGPRSHLLIQARGGRGRELLTIQDIGTAAPSLTLRNTAGMKEYEVEFTQIIQPAERASVFRMTKLTVAQNAPVELRITQNQTALEVTTLESAVGYDLELRSRTRKGEKVIEQPHLQIQAGHSQVVQPRSWLNLRKEDLQREVRAIGRREIKQ